MNVLERFDMLLKCSSEYSAGFLLAVRTCQQISHLSLSVVLVNSSRKCRERARKECSHLAVLSCKGLVRCPRTCVVSVMTIDRVSEYVRCLLLIEDAFSPLSVHFEHGVMCKILLSSTERSGSALLWAMRLSMRECWKWYLLTSQLFRLLATKH